MIDSRCLVDSPITVSDLDFMTDETAAQIEDHNDSWARACDRDDE